jgi:hypothetical protein
MPADAYWTLAMAVNVYLTFYWKFDAESLRKLEKYYIMICYGAPFVPAFVYLWIKTPEKGHLYGNATLWCWVSSEWDVLRIYTFYGPVWYVRLSMRVFNIANLLQGCHPSYNRYLHPSWKRNLHQEEATPKLRRTSTGSHANNRRSIPVCQDN